MSRLRTALPVLALGFLLAAGAALLATDPPHNIATANAYGSLNYCSTCHKLHGAAGGTLTTASGNTNLCLSCHVSGGKATNKAFATVDQAVPAGASLVGSSAAGTSHRWDSSAAGRLTKGTPNSSTGSITPSGDYTGAYAATIKLQVATGGPTGTAKVAWSQTINGTASFGSATTITTSTTPQVLGTTGVSLAFSGTGTFVLNDIFYLYVRPDLVNPASAAMSTRLEGGKIMCSTCHDQHLQAKAPFDPSAPTSYTAGVTTGRHNMRLDNDANQMCVDCHSARNVAASGGSSHPLSILSPSTLLKLPSSTLKLRSDSKVQCLTCHQVHYSATTDGNLLRESNTSALCQECHTNALATATHMSTASGVLWPGGQYGSTYPAISDTTKRGACVNCHDPHGWPDPSTPGAKFPKLLVENRANLCLTCHDGTPASDQKTSFATDRWVTAGAGASNNLKLNSRHDIYPSDTTKSGAAMGCGSCHDPHQVTSTSKVTTDPDPGDGIVPAAGKRITGLDLKSEICLDCHDGSFPPSITPPTTALNNIATSYKTDAHGMGSGRPSLKAGANYWAAGDVVPCMTCHEPHGSSNLFHLRTKVYGKDGVTQIPADARTGGLLPTDPVQVTTQDNQLLTNGYYFCNTCHTSSMGSGKSNCFACHYHSTRF